MLLSLLLCAALAAVVVLSMQYQTACGQKDTPTQSAEPTASANVNVDINGQKVLTG